MSIIGLFHHHIVKPRRSLHCQLVFLLRQPNILADRARTLPAPKIITDLVLFGLFVRARTAIATVAAKPVDPFCILVGYSASEKDVAGGRGEIGCCVATHLLLLYAQVFVFKPCSEATIWRGNDSQRSVNS